MIKGSIVALVTPFNADGSVNFEEFGNLLEYHIANDTAAICILGTTAEASTLSFEEEEEIVKFAVKKVNKRIKLIVGSGSNETEKAIMMSKKYSSLGADYLLVITPYYNKTNESGLIKHFTHVADEASCPIILYNVPGRTGMSISLTALEVLAKHPNIVGIKEASGDMSYASKVAKLTNENFVMYSGNDDIIVPMMSIGSSGVISVVANIAPKQTANIVKYCLDGNYQEARKIQLDLLEVINSLFFEVNPIPVKAALNYLGFNVGGYREPLDTMSKAKYDQMVQIIESKKEIVF